MTREEALDKLELDEGASAAQIEQSYQELYNEFQMRITNAPTEHQRKLYQQKLAVLEKAYSVLSTDGTGNFTGDDLPATSATHQQVHEPSKAVPLGETKALEILGLEKPVFKSDFTKAFKTKQKELEAGKKQAPTAEIARAYDLALKQLDEAAGIIGALIMADPMASKPAKEANEQAKTGTNAPKAEVPKSQPKAKVKTPDKKSSTGLVVSIVLVVVIAGGLFYWQPWDTNDSEHQKAYNELITQAKQREAEEKWQEALNLYQKADSIRPNTLTEKLATLEGTIQDGVWQESLAGNSKKSYENYLTLYPDGKYMPAAKDSLALIEALIAEIKVLEGKEAGVQKASKPATSTAAPATQTIPFMEEYRGATEESNGKTTLRFLPDQGQLVAGNWQGLKVFDIETGQILRRIGEDEGIAGIQVNDLEVTKDRIIAASLNGVSIYNARSGERLNRLFNFETIEAIEVDPSGTMAAILNGKEYAVKIVSLETGESYDLLSDLEGKILHMDFSKDWQYALFIREKNLTVCDLATNREVFIKDISHYWRSTVISTDNRYFYISHDKANVAQYELQTGNRVKKYNLWVPSEVTLSPDNNILFARSKRDIHAWDTRTGKKLAIYKGYNDYNATLPVTTPDGQYLLSGTEGKGILKWDLSTLK